MIAPWLCRGLLDFRLQRIVDDARRLGVELNVQRAGFACLSALHTRAGDSGRSRCRTPRVDGASSTALTAAGSEPATPDSPAPLAPSGFVVHGTP